MRRAISIAEILETERRRKIMTANSSNDLLQIVPALAGNANGLALNLRGDFEFGVANKSGDLFGDRLLNALLDFDDLTGMAQRRNVRRHGFDAFQADVALGQFTDDDFVQRRDLELVLGGEFDFVFFEHDFCLRAFEIKAGSQFFFGLVDGILDFHRADFGDDIK